MRIAYLCADYGVPVLGGKGASVHVQQFIASLTKLGHEVVLYCSRLGEGDPKSLPARVIEIARPPSRSERTDVVDEPQARPTAGSSHERRAKELAWRDQARALEARVLADHARQPFDMVYERYSLWSRAAVAIAARTGIASVVEVNAPLLTEAMAYRELAAKAEAQAIEADVFAKAGDIVAVSEGVRDYVMAQGAAASRVHVVPNGVDTATFNPAVEPARIPALDGYPVIGFVGGLKPWHGLQELLEAFRSVVRARPEARLLVVGDGPMRGWIEGYLAGSGLGHKVVLTGWQSHEALPGLIRRMDIATAPYPPIDDFYFSPLKLFEYMSMGRAIVASRIGQIAETITHEKSGLLVEPGSVNELATQLLRLVDDQKLRQQIGAGALALSNRYSWMENARGAVALGAAQRRTGLLAVAIGAAE